MCDATFFAYAGYSYLHYSGGAMLEPNDYAGLAALLVQNTSAPIRPPSEDKMRAALRRLLDNADGHPVVREVLT